MLKKDCINVLFTDMSDLAVENSIVSAEQYLLRVSKKKLNVLHLMNCVTLCI